MQSSRRISKGNEPSQMTMNRRQWLTTASAGSLGGMALQGYEAEQGEPKPQPKPLDLSQYEPRSMLHVKQTPVERARYPVIDIHTHLSFSTKVENGVSLAPERRFLTDAESSLPVMDACNLRALTNLTGGFGNGLVESI